MKIDVSSRGNHNGMHSLRQLRLLEYIINQLSPKKSETFKQFSSEEQFVLKCGAIFLRAGRIDETSHQSGDDWYARSLRIFSEYMTQLGIKEATIQWMKPIMCESCKPESAFKNY
tara:strand:- start:462 stop:806 length:345 start_codon:yes stop_codon:yes gene_type:complete